MKDKNGIGLALLAGAAMCAIVAFGGTNALAGDRSGPDVAAPRTDWAGGSYHYLMNEMSRAVRGQEFEFVVFGDSITMGWIYPETDKGWPGGREVWQRHFGKLKTANFCVSGDRTEHVLWRIVKAGQADGWTAKTIALAVGINNNIQVRPGWATNDTPAQAACGVKAVIGELLARHPESKIALIGLLPTPGGDGRAYGWVRDCNAELAKLAGGRVSFHDIGARFLAAPTEQLPGLFRDTLHPLPAGYEVYARELERIVAACAVPERLGRDISDRIYTWGYVLDRKPTACPFVFGKTDVSLETAAAGFRSGKAMYMNSMFDRDYILKHFPDWDRECLANCIDTRLSDRHWELLKDIPEVWCALQHGDKLGSARRIAELSLRHRNIRGVNLDDFKDGNPANDMTPGELMELRRTIRAINPELQVAVVTYEAEPGENREFDLTPYRDAIDLVSRWKWRTDSAFWDGYRACVEKVRAQVGPRVKIVQGLYLHDFGSGMNSRSPVPLDYFKRSVRAACACVADGTLDGIILPQVGWYSSPAHQEHVRWLKAYLSK